MAKTPAIKEYAADMNVTPAGSTDEEIIAEALAAEEAPTEEAPTEEAPTEEVYVSPTVLAEMAAGAARLAQLAQYAPAPEAE